MKRFSLPVLIVGGSLIAIIQFAESRHLLPDFLAPRTVPMQPQRDLLCGPRSLHTALNLLGIPATVNNVVSQCKVETNGVRFGELVEAATQSGAGAKLHQLTWDELRESSTTCVLFVDGNHYVAADSRGAGDLVTIYDGTRVARSVDREELEARWHGEALVLSRVKLNQPLVLETCWIDAGFAQGDEQRFQIGLTNSSASPVSIRVAGASCSCTTASLSSELILPGATEYLDATVSLKERRGSYRETVEIDAGSAQPTIEVWLCGGRFADRLCRDREYMGTFRAGEQVKVPVYIHDPGDRSLELNADQISAELTLGSDRERLECAVDVERVEDGDLAIGKLAQYPVKAGDFRLVLSTRIPVQSVPQSLSGTLVVTTALGAPLDIVEIALSGEIAGDLECDPPALLFAAGETVYKSHLTLRTSPGKELTLGDVTFSSDSVHVVLDKTSVQQSTHVLPLDASFTLSQSLKVGPSHTLHISTSVGDIDIPVLFQQSRPMSTSLTKGTDE